MNVITVVIFATGALLIYSGVKDIDPRDVVADAINGSSGKPKANKARAGEKDGRNAQTIPYQPEDDNGTAGV
jgi:hypothetical protein